MPVCRHGRFRLFLFGVGLGTAAGILLAPKSGKEIRRELFGGPLDILGEPGTEKEAPLAPMESPEDLKSRIEETRARLKAEIEGNQEENA